MAPVLILVTLVFSGLTLNASATFKYTISGDADGKHFDSGGLGRAMLEKRGGQWRIVHSHSSAPRRQPAPVAAPK